MSGPEMWKLCICIGGILSDAPQSASWKSRVEISDSKRDALQGRYRASFPISIQKLLATTRVYGMSSQIKWSSILAVHVSPTGTQFE